MNLESTISLLESKIEKCVVEKDKHAYLEGPCFDIKRNRVNAEYCKGLLRLGEKPEIVKKMVDYLISTQNADGSWNEIHPYYDKPSSLITSIVGDALLEYYKKEQERYLKDAIDAAKNYVMSNAKEPGYFIKSSNFRQDHLNVDITCADFLSAYGAYFSDTKTQEIANKTVEHVRDHQFENGVFPYRVDTEEIKTSMEVPCIHYQGVTIYYLHKTLENLNFDDITWLKKGLEWLEKTQKEDGKFDWSFSGFMFAYHLTGAYGFAYASYECSDDSDSYSKHSNQCLDELERNMDELLLRWEKGSWLNLITSFEAIIKSSQRGSDSFSELLYNFGYASYREFSRRRYTMNPKKDFLFEMLKELLSIETSTIEPSKNFPDLFMTTECFDCLTYAKSNKSN